MDVDRTCVGLDGSPVKVVRITRPKVTRNGKIIDTTKGTDLKDAVTELLKFLDEKELI
jgi:electron transfer flavoprotein beta subunit